VWVRPICITLLGQTRGLVHAWRRRCYAATTAVATYKPTHGQSSYSCVLRTCLLIRSTWRCRLCVRAGDGRVLTWGEGKFGRLGLGDERPRASPVVIAVDRGPERPPPTALRARRLGSDGGGGGGGDGGGSDGGGGEGGGGGEDDGGWGDPGGQRDWLSQAWPRSAVTAAAAAAAAVWASPAALPMAAQRVVQVGGHFARPRRGGKEEGGGRKEATHARACNAHSLRCLAAVSTPPRCVRAETFSRGAEASTGSSDMATR
jgi:hypothetical protein